MLVLKYVKGGFMKKIFIIVFSTIVIVGISLGIVYTRLKGREEKIQNSDNKISSSKTNKEDVKELYNNTEFFWGNKENTGKMYWSGSDNYKKYMLPKSNDYMTVAQDKDKTYKLIGWNPIFKSIFNQESTTKVEEYIYWTAVSACNNRNNNKNNDITVHCMFDKEHRGENHVQSSLKMLSNRCKEMQRNAEYHYTADSDYPIVISGLENTRVNNREINYIRAQWKHTQKTPKVVRDENGEVKRDQNNKTIQEFDEQIMYKQEYYAIMEFDLNNEEKGFVKMLISDYSVNPDELSDPSIIDEAYERVAFNLK